jgi:UDP-N-acetylglucosamine 2-epimerase (non-hydrolysing)
MIDSLIRFQPLFDSVHIKDACGFQNKEYVLITLHRPSNVDDPVNLGQLIASLNNVAETAPCLWPLHPRTRKQLDNITPKLHDRLFIIDPLGYLEFMGLQRDAAAVITDSGGIQEESTFLGVPCLTVRDNTERPITIEQGTNRLVGTEYSNIPEIVKEVIVEKSVPRVPELWDGKSSERIANVLQSC